MNELLTLPQMAALANVHPNILYRNIIKLQQYGAFRFGGNGHWRMEREDFEKYIKGVPLNKTTNQ